MPGYRTHTFGGLVVAGGTLSALVAFDWYAPDLFTSAMLVTVAMFAALLPDVDTNSKGQHLFYGMLLVFDAALIGLKHYRWAALLGLVSMLPAVSRHRGWTHSWWAMLLVPATIAAVPFVALDLRLQDVGPYYGAAVLGYASHLVLDGKW